MFLILISKSVFIHSTIEVAEYLNPVKPSLENVTDVTIESLEKV